MTEVNLNELMNALQPLCNKLGVGVEHIWSSAVADAKFSAIFTIVALSIWGMIGLLGSIYCNHKIMKSQYDDWTRYHSAFILSVLMIFITSIFTMCNASLVYNGLYNSDLPAFQTIINCVNGVR